MTDVFSKLTRKYISMSKNRELSATLAVRSLIQKGTSSEVEIERRIEELDGYEQRLGFVYQGEKKWLASGGIISGVRYSDWVLTQLNTAVFSDGLIFEEDTVRRQWRGYTESISVLALFPELKENSIQIDNLLLSIPGDTTQPAPAQLCQAFEVLHNLAYYLHVVGERSSEEVFLDEIVLGAEEGRWHMDLINDFGSVGTVGFSDDQLLTC